jgi:hypothetical protein
MMKNSITSSALLAASVSMGACSDPKEASEDNFRAIIEPVVKNAFCRQISIPQYRLTEKYTDDAPAFPLIIGATPPQWGGSTETEMRSMLEAATKQGLLTRTAKTAPAVYGSSSDALKPAQLITYEPTDKGKDVFRGVGGKRTGSPERPSVCFGEGKVDDIVRWTEPADAFGQTMTQVTYTYSGKNFPDSVPKEMIEQASKPKEATIGLIKMSDGWQAMK